MVTKMRKMLQLQTFLLITNVIKKCEIVTRMEEKKKKNIILMRGRIKNNI